jgi:hypothetical protein
VNEQLVAHIPMLWTIPSRFLLDETFDAGRDTGTPGLEEYTEMALPNALSRKFMLSSIAQSSMVTI